MSNNFSLIETEPLTEVSLDTLIINVQNNIDNGASFTEICRRFNRLVVKYASQSHLREIKDDAISEGWLAVVKAVRDYNPSQQIRFAGYVDCCVKYAMWNFFKKNRRNWDREMIAETNPENKESGVFKTALADIDVENEVVDKIDRAIMSLKIQEILPSLTPKQRFVVKKVFWDERTLRQVAVEMNTTNQAAFNLKERGLKWFKQKFAGGEE